MSYTFTLPDKFKPIKNPWFHVECNTLQDYVVHFTKLDKDYHQIAINSERTPSVTHRSLHGKRAGRRSFDVQSNAKLELLDISAQAVEQSRDMFNIEDRSARLQSCTWLLYEQDLGCTPHCDDQDPADAEYGVGSTVFNWANQLIVLLYTSEFGVDFEGGELLLHNQQQVIRPKRGEIIIFPGSYTHIHSVQPIISGIRTVLLTAWRFDDYYDL